MAEEKRSFYLKNNSYWLRLSGRQVHAGSFSGMDRLEKFASEDAARQRFEALSGRFQALVDKEKGRSGKKPRAKIQAPKLKASKPLDQIETDRLVAIAMARASKRGDPWLRGAPCTAKDLVRAAHALAPRGQPPVQLPASFIKFMRRYGAIGAGQGDPGLRLLSPKNMILDTKKLVRVPRGLRWETPAGKEVAITTDHLVAFASAGPEARWCFCIDPRSREAPVYWHHQDEPRARIIGGGFLDKRTARPDYVDFSAWFRAQARR